MRKLIKHTCLACGKDFHSPPSRVGKFCSNKCRYSIPKSKETREKLSRALKKHFKENGSHHKGKKRSKETIERIIKSKIGKYKGPKSGAWQGGKWTTKTGRTYIYMPDHPCCNSRGYVIAHRLVMEKVLGRYLSSDEIVHHKDENPLNNHFTNLEVMTKAEHMRHHALKRHSEFRLLFPEVVCSNMPPDVRRFLQEPSEA